jgi:glycine/D-amino acid oxidase-like deaminating enzyme
LRSDSSSTARGYDVVVVGRGIVGVSAALRCARAGARGAVVDSAAPGQATAAGAGIVSPVGLGGDEVGDAWTSLVGSAIRAYHRLLDSLEDTGHADPGFARVGEVVAATREQDHVALSQLAVRLEELRHRGVDLGAVERLQGKDLAGAWPELSPELEGLYIENVGRVDGRRMRATLEAAGTAAGATFLEAECDLRLTGRRASVLVDGRPVPAGSVVVAAGAWSQPFLHDLGVTVSVRPVRGQIVHLGVAGTGIERRPVVNTFEDHYFLGFPDQRVVTGATHEPEARFDHRVTAGGLASVLERALRIAPGLAGATVLETRVGFRPHSSDGYPLVGRAPASDDVVLATGLGAWGLTLGPLIGQVAAEQALGLPVSYDAEFLDPGRLPIAAPPVVPHAPTRTGATSAHTHPGGTHS